LLKKELQPVINYSTPTLSNSTKTTQRLTDKLKIMVGMSTTIKQSKSLTIDDELVLFTQTIQSYKNDFAPFWIQHRQRFSRMYKVARRVNIIPATSVPSEFVFSIAGCVARMQRSSLSSVSLRYLMVLKQSYRVDALRAKSSVSIH
jgi:hAT family C-terminal dimerisation region